MSIGSGLGFADDAEVPLVAEGETVFTRGDLQAAADDLIERMQAHRAKRALVCSDRPFHILRALDACARAGADLFVAHTNLQSSQIDELVAAHGIQVLLGEDEKWLLPPGEQAASGRIFMMTSGTTGRPKIAAHTLDSLLARARASARHPVNRGGHWLLTYQQTGFAGMQVTLTAVLARGLLVAPTTRTPASFHEAARRWQVTQISGTPTFWRAFLMAASPDGLDPRQITLGGEAADQATLDRLKAAFPNARITHTYASTEAGMVYAVHDGLEGFPAAWLEQPTIQGVQLRVCDGYLHVKSPNAMHGYINEVKQPHLDDGWLATSDRVEIVGDRVRVIGRDDATINVGGSKVYPLMVETFLLRQPSVMEARVYGVRSPISGYFIAADIVVEPDADTDAARRRVLAACREGLADYQVPRMLKVVDAIEVRTSGKKG